MKVSGTFHVDVIPPDMGEDWDDIDLGYCTATSDRASFTVQLADDLTLTINRGAVTGRRRLKAGGLGQSVCKNDWWYRKEEHDPEWLKRARARALKSVEQLLSD